MSEDDIGHQEGIPRHEVQKKKPDTKRTHGTHPRDRTFQSRPGRPTRTGRRRLVPRRDSCVTGRGQARASQGLTQRLRSACKHSLRFTLTIYTLVASHAATEMGRGDQWWPRGCWAASGTRWVDQSRPGFLPDVLPFCFSARLPFLGFRRFLRFVPRSSGRKILSALAEPSCGQQEGGGWYAGLSMCHRCLSPGDKSPPNEWLQRQYFRVCS